MNVTIVGGGICGLSAALALQKKGIPCSIISNSVGSKTCGGGLTEKTTERYRWIRKYGDEFACRKMKRINLWFGGDNIEIESHMTVCNRKALDLFLAEQVRSKGIKIEKAQVLSVNPRRAGFVLKTTKGERKPDFVYDASGALGPLNGGQGKEHFLAIQHTYPVGSDFIDCHIPDELHVDFGFEKLDGFGYLWVFPDRDEIKVGLGFLNKQRVQNKVIQEELDHLIESRFRWLKGKKYRVESAFLSAPTKHIRVEWPHYFVGGDAAGLVNVLGEGNYFSMLSSEMFADSIDSPPGTYSREIKTLKSALIQQYVLIKNVIKNPVIRKTVFKIIPAFHLNGLLRKFLKKEPVNSKAHSLICEL